MNPELSAGGFEWTDYHTIGLVLFVSGIGLGGVAMWAICRAIAQKQLTELHSGAQVRESELVNEAKVRESEIIADAQARESELNHLMDQQEAVWGEKLKTLESAHEKLSDSFKALSADALKNNQESFMTMAKEVLAKESAVNQGDLELRKTQIGEMVKPIAESLGKVDARINDIEKAREGAYR
ncbi:MAG: hypothetical protein AAF226_18070, partial [Verrucomicrobiota bacterium]